MRCVFCGNEFDEKKAEQGCRGCPSAIGCGGGKVKCPHCGYESPRVPKWIERIAAFFKKK